ncbi:MAG: CoA-binding protein [Deltaproteobacteria bacterium]|nr:CoA-binding protein [Candidatus Zymogenaceae bacterium]
MKLDEFQTLDRIIHPASVAVVGASSSPGKFGWLYIKALIDLNFSGRLFPVNDHADEILGVKTYPTLAELPEVPDLLVVTVPARFVADYLEEALALGIPGAVVMSSGFTELSQEGAAMQAHIAEIAARGIRIIGPNCFGIYSPRAGITLIPGSGFSRDSGPVGFFAQSGGMTADLGQMAMSRGIRFSAMISYGNAVDVDEIELLEYFAADPNTHFIASYMEGVVDGRRFFEILGKVAKIKPVVIWKAGITEAGARAAASHTGSMGGSRRLWESLFSQTGVIGVRGLEEMLDVLMMLAYVYPRGGRNVAIVGGGGGLAVEASDLAELSGLRLPRFPADVTEQIASLLQGAGSAPTNPVDAGNPVVHPSVLVKIMKMAAALPDVDTLMVVQFLFHIYILFRRMSGQADIPLSTFATYPVLADGIREICNEFGKPVIGVFPETATSENDEEVQLEIEWRKARHALLNAGAPVYPSMERALVALAKMVDHLEYLKSRGIVPAPIGERCVVTQY